MLRLSLVRTVVLGAAYSLGCSAGGTPSSGISTGVGSAGAAANSGGSSSSSAGATLSGAGADFLPPQDPGTGGAGTNAAQQCEGKFTGYLRDFTIAQPDGSVQSPNLTPQIAETVNNVPYLVSPDFEVRLHDMSKVYDDDRGIVQSTLGADSEPVYAGPAGGTPTTTGPANFQTWFHDTPGVNLGQALTLQFAQDSSKPSDPNAYTFSSGSMGSACLGPDKAYCAGFYPIDGLLLGNEGNNHNYHLTFELHLKFRYHAGQTFTFKGDDDVWVYANHALAVDLGGLHQAQEQAVLDLNTLGLSEGQIYALDFFWCERHVTASNFHIDTSLEVVDCGIVK